MYTVALGLRPPPVIVAYASFSSDPGPVEAQPWLLEPAGEAHRVLGAGALTELTVIRREVNEPSVASERTLTVARITYSWPLSSRRCEAAHRDLAGYVGAGGVVVAHPVAVVVATRALDLVAVC